MTDIQREILIANYWENFKFAKELALIYPIQNKKRKLIEKSVDDINECLKLNSHEVVKVEYPI